MIITVDMILIILIWMDNLFARETIEDAKDAKANDKSNRNEFEWMNGKSVKFRCIINSIQMAIQMVMHNLNDYSSFSWDSHLLCSTINLLAFTGKRCFSQLHGKHWLLLL